jgi:hypothetical protein
MSRNLIVLFGQQELRGMIADDVVFKADGVVYKKDLQGVQSRLGHERAKFLFSSVGHGRPGMTDRA